MTIHASGRADRPDPAADRTFRAAPGASAAWVDDTGRWFVYMRDGAWIARDRSLPADRREHGRDQERAFYTAAEMLRHIDATEAGPVIGRGIRLDPTDDRRPIGTRTRTQEPAR